MSKPKWLRNPWQQNPWFESVAVAQRRARKRLPAPVYGAPEIPEKVDLKTMIRMAPQVLVRPRWAAQFARAGIPDLTAPNLAPPGGAAPTFFGAHYAWMTTPPPEAPRSVR